MTRQRHLVDTSKRAHHVRGLGAAWLIGTVLALCVQAPASWLTHAVNQLSEGHILMHDARGSVWNGSAQVGLSSRLAWSMQLSHQGAWPAFQFNVHADCCTRDDIKVRVSPSWHGIDIQLLDHASLWPASWLSQLGAPWNTLQPQGQLAFQTHDVRWQSNQPDTFSGNIEIQLQQLSTQLSTLRPLGSYELQINGGLSPTLALKTIDGALVLTGQGQWVNRRLRFQGEASAQEGSEAALSNLLNVLGQRRGKISVLNMS